MGQDLRSARLPWKLIIAGEGPGGVQQERLGTGLQGRRAPSVAVLAGAGGKPWMVALSKSGWDRTSALVRSATLVVGTRQVRNIGWSPPCPARWGSARVGAPGTAREPSFLDSSESHSIHAGERVSECCSESCDCVSRSVARCSPCVVRSVPPGSSPLRGIKRTPSDGAPARTRRLDHTVGSATKEGATSDRGLWVPPSLPLARPSIGDPGISPFRS